MEWVNDFTIKETAKPTPKRKKASTVTIVKNKADSNSED